MGIVGVTSVKPEQREWEDVATLDFIDPVEALEGGRRALWWLESSISAFIAASSEDAELGEAQTTWLPPQMLSRCGLPFVPEWW